MIRKKLELVPDEESKAQPLFDTEQAYQEFQVSLQQEVKGELDRQREARRQSEERAKRCLIS
ncbi:MAG TPA: hypothetical protein ENH11_09800 [Candidatus Acetothermia bacterium]|nr:hypothetical protein [Candidatus Acetothermia bacterium]